MSRPERKIEWTDVALADVLRHFAAGYEFKDGAKLVQHEAFVDAAKGRVVFKLTTQLPEAT
ncbi:MAG TPA: hypothetical protein VF534_01720 [Paraburkholderia sp.]